MSIPLFITRLQRIPEITRDLIMGTLLLVIAGVGAVVFGRILDHVPFIVAFDTFFYEKIQLGPHPAWLNAIVSPFNFNFLPWGGTFIPSFLYFVFFVGFVYIAIRHRKELLWAAISLLLAIAIDGIFFKITHTYVIRDRPFIHLPNNLTESAKAIWRSWPTYPSGHVRDAALYTTVLAGYAKELRWPALLFVLWICYTRIYIGAHYPTDVIAGFVMGLIVGIAVLLLIKPLRAHFLRESEGRKAKKNASTRI